MSGGRRRGRVLALMAGAAAVLSAMLIAQSERRGSAGSPDRVAGPASISVATVDRHAADPGVAGSVQGVNDRQEAKALERRSPGKPVGPIAIDYRLARAPQVGQAVEITITAHARIALRNVTVDVSAGEGLLLDPVFLPAPTVVPAEAPIEWTVTVTPTLDGTAYLNVHVAGEAGAREVARSVAIAIRTGGTKSNSATASVLKVDESGNTLIVLPADEGR